MALFVHLLSIILSVGLLFVCNICDLSFTEAINTENQNRSTNGDNYTTNSIYIIIGAVVSIVFILVLMVVLITIYCQYVREQTSPSKTSSKDKSKPNPPQGPVSRPSAGASKRSVWTDGRSPNSRGLQKPSQELDLQLQTDSLKSIQSTTSSPDIESQRKPESESNVTNEDLKTKSDYEGNTVSQQSSQTLSKVLRADTANQDEKPSSSIVPSRHTDSPTLPADSPSRIDSPSGIDSPASAIPSAIPSKPQSNKEDREDKLGTLLEDKEDKLKKLLDD